MMPPDRPAMPRRHWLIKSEPFKYSWDRFVAEGRATWDGVRNFEARKRGSTSDLRLRARVASKSANTNPDASTVWNAREL